MSAELTQALSSLPAPSDAEWGLVKEINRRDCSSAVWRVEAPNGDVFWIGRYHTKPSPYRRAKLSGSAGQWMIAKADFCGGRGAYSAGMRWLEAQELFAVGFRTQRDLLSALRARWEARQSSLS